MAFPETSTTLEAECRRELVNFFFSIRYCNFREKLAACKVVLREDISELKVQPSDALDMAITEVAGFRCKVVLREDISELKVQPSDALDMAITEVAGFRLKYKMLSDALFGKLVVEEAVHYSKIQNVTQPQQGPGPGPPSGTTFHFHGLPAITFELDDFLANRADDESDLLANCANDEPDLPANCANDEQDLLANFANDEPDLPANRANDDQDLRANGETAHGWRRLLGLPGQVNLSKVLSALFAVGICALVMQKRCSVQQNNKTAKPESRDSKESRNIFNLFSGNTVNLLGKSNDKSLNNGANSIS